MNRNFGDFRFDGPYYDPEYFMKKELERKALRKLGIYTGSAVLLSILFQNILVLILQLTGLHTRYYDDAYFSSAVDILIVVIGMLLPFVLLGKKMKKASGAVQPIMLGKPYRPSLMLPAIFAGIGFCMIGNIVNTYISSFFSNFNVEFSSPEIPMAEGVSGIIITFFRVAVTAAIVEELSFRGFVMGNLRFFGDGFAIVVSSVVFAILHGNMVQAPFALMVGCALGYLSVKTGTLWTGIIIHALNNSLSIAVYYLSKSISEEQLAGLYVLFRFVTITLGIISFGYFSLKTRGIPVSKGGTVLEGGEKVRAYFLNFPMIATVLYMLYITAEYVNLG